MAPDYDNNDPPPTSLGMAMSYKDSAASAVYSNFSIKLTPSLMFATAPHKYTRSFEIATPSDTTNYDCGTLFLMNSIDTTTLFTYGDFWVTYDITLRSPQVPRALSTTIPVGASNSYQMVPVNYSPADLNFDYDINGAASIKAIPAVTVANNEIPDLFFEAKESAFRIPANSVFDFIFNPDLRLGKAGAQQFPVYSGVEIGYETSSDDGATWTNSGQITRSMGSGSAGGTTAVGLNPTLLGVVANALATSILLRPFIRGYLNDAAGAALSSPLWAIDTGDVFRFTNRLLRKLTPL